MDRRTEKTKRSILNAFIALRSHKELERITVRELCENAEINKSTFYAHYQDIYDLSDCLEQEIVASVIRELEDPAEVLKDPAGFTGRLCLEYCAKSALISTVFSGSRKNSFVARTETEIKKLVYEMNPEYRNNPYVDILLTYTIYGAYYAFYENQKYGVKAVIEAIQEFTQSLFASRITCREERKDAEDAKENHAVSKDETAETGAF